MRLLVVLIGTLFILAAGSSGPDLFLDDVLAYDDDDTHILYYQDDDAFVYNDYESRSYNHGNNYEYYYQYNSKVVVEYVSTIHTRARWLYSVAVAGSTVMTGGIGLVYVFEYENNRATFQRTWMMPPSPQLFDPIECIVATDGKRTVVSPYDLFVLRNSVWSLEANLTIVDIVNSLSISGDTFVYGSLESYNATVFRRSTSGIWYVEAKFHGYTNFATGVSVSGDRLLISSPYEPVSGRVFYYLRNGSTWVYQDAIVQPNLFGTSVTMSGDYAVIGTYGPHVTYVYKLEDGVWVRQGQFNVGCMAIAMSGTTIVLQDLRNSRSLRVYSLSDDTANEKSSGASQPVVVIAGAVGGGVAAIIMLCMGYFCCFHRGKTKLSKYWWKGGRVVPTESAETVKLDVSGTHRIGIV